MPAPSLLHEHITGMVRLLAARNQIRQSDLARELGVDKAVITRAFQGRREWRLAEVERLAEVFGVECAVLMSDPEDYVPGIHAVTPPAQTYPRQFWHSVA